MSVLIIGDGVDCGGLGLNIGGFRPVVNVFRRRLRKSVAAMTGQVPPRPVNEPKEVTVMV
jgi:hypothetical protein